MDLITERYIKNIKKFLVVRMFLPLNIFSTLHDVHEKTLKLFYIFPLEFSSRFPQFLYFYRKILQKIFVNTLEWLRGVNNFNKHYLLRSNRKLHPYTFVNFKVLYSVIMKPVKTVGNFYRFWTLCVRPIIHINWSNFMTVRYF